MAPMPPPRPRPQMSVVNVRFTDDVAVHLGAGRGSTLRRHWPPTPRARSLRALAGAVVVVDRDLEARFRGPLRTQSTPPTVAVLDFVVVAVAGNLTPGSWRRIMRPTPRRHERDPLVVTVAAALRLGSSSLLWLWRLRLLQSTGARRPAPDHLPRPSLLVSPAADTNAFAIANAAARMTMPSLLQSWIFRLSYLA